MDLLANRFSNVNPLKLGLCLARKLSFYDVILGTARVVTRARFHEVERHLSLDDLASGVDAAIPGILPDTDKSPKTRD
jgi:hypothetical protein